MEISPKRVKKTRALSPILSRMDDDDIELMVIELHQRTIDLLNRLDYARLCRATASQEAAAARNRVKVLGYG